MGRVLAIDYGTKRVGLAVTDQLQMIANPLDTIHAKDLITYLRNYLQREQVDTIVLGLPKTLGNEDTTVTQAVRNLEKHLKRTFPTTKITCIDERFTSKMALDSMLAMGSKKKDRSKKENIDKISATIILQSFLEQGN